jgi:hexosaminidase
VNANGRQSSVYGSTVWRREPLAAFDLKDFEKGIIFRAYEQQNFASVGEIDKGESRSWGPAKSLGLGQFKEKLKEELPFAVIFEGFINVPADEIYEFELEADDGAALVVDKEMVVDNDGTKEKPEKKSGFVPLKKGFHWFTLKYFKGQGKWALGLRWGVKGQPLRGVSENDLARQKY